MSRHSPESLQKRFDDRTIPEPNSGCLLWMGEEGKGGYGQLLLHKEKIAPGKYRKFRIYAHRLAWELEHGPIPDGIRVLHSCDNPPCCNEGHLFLGTPADNTHDMMRKGRAQIGSKHYAAKVDEDDVRKIRKSKKSLGDLAIEFKIAKQTLSQIRRRSTWKQVA